MDVLLHLGAHKTATTFLQMHWQACNPRAAQAGAFAPRLEEVRRRMTPAAQVSSRHTRHSATADAHQFLDELAAGWHRVVISDENILGTSRGNFAGGALYGQARERLSAIHDLLGGRRTTVLLSVRSYADFLSSSYCEVLRHGKFAPFRSMLGRLDVAQRGWSDVVEDIAQALAGASILVWRYEDLEAIQPRLTETVLQVRAAEQPAPPKGRPRQSFTQQAIDAATAAYETDGVDAAGQALARAARRPRDPRLVKFDPWSPEERAALDAAYTCSCTKLATMSGVEFVAA